MPTNDYSKNIVYLSKEQYQELITNETLTVNGQTIAYNDNDIYVTPQAEPITDVKINGTSIGSNGVANIPIGNSTNLGVVKKSIGYGINIGSDGILTTVFATQNDIKGGVNAYCPIMPGTQHISTYYGLSKLAGVDLASVTCTLGIYPDTSKAAIQNMLGITDLISTEESSTATAAHALNSTFMMDGKLHRATAAIAIGDAVEVGTNCQVVKADEVFVNKKQYATSGTPGLVSVSSSFGVGIWSNSGAIFIQKASANELKAGTHNYHPVVPANLDTSIYYGLSKLAGVDLASETVTVGTYPNTSKVAIRSLIGAGTPLDVQIDGTSIISNGIANLPYPNWQTPGVVKTNADYGLTTIAENTDTKGTIRVYAATDENIKAGTNIYRPIVSSKQHVAIYYGLSKLAGVDLASETVTVGTYPAISKAAIRNLIGATSSNVIAVQDEQPTNADTKVWLPETEVQGIQVPTMEDMANYVQKTDLATGTTVGVVKAKNFGIKVNNTGELYISKADINSEVKSGVANYLPIVPSNQHAAAFYGLAKAAGDTTQSISTNAVGTYTDSAKIAIKNMLGVTQTLTVTVLTQDNVTVTNQTVTLREGGPTGQVYATATYSGQPVSFALPTGFSYYVSVSDTLAHHFNPTTASGIITDADAAATLTYSDFSSIQTAADIKAALNAGLDLTDLVGEQISCIWNNSTLVWDVVDYSNDTITLLTHDTLPTQLAFEPVQALMWCENGLAAGSYSFIDGSSTYYFTFTTAIPSGGQLRATTSTFQTYASMEATATLETGTVSTTEISGATSLGTTANGNLNHMSRVNYGSNNYKESALFQWLNSTEAANTPMPRITKFSRPCTYSVPGFLGALDSSFVAAIDDTTWLCSTNNTYECPTSLGGTVAKSNAYTVTAKVGLASEMEIFGSYGGTADGSAVFDLFNGATADDRKKYQPGTSTTRHWWLRSPEWSYASHERYVHSSGPAGRNYAYGSYGVVPAVKISKTVVSE